MFLCIGHSQGKDQHSLGLHESQAAQVRIHTIASHKIIRFGTLLTYHANILNYAFFCLISVMIK